MVTVEFTTSNAAPFAGTRRLQSKNVAEGTPLMASDTKLLILTVDSTKRPAERTRIDMLLLYCRTAKVIVLQGAVNPQPIELMPLAGSTVTDKAETTLEAGNANAMNEINKKTNGIYDLTAGRKRHTCFCVVSCKYSRSAWQGMFSNIFLRR